MPGRDVEEELQDQPVGEEDRVVQERLRDHQRRAVDGPARVVLEQRLQQGQVADLLGRPDLQFPARVHRRELALGLADVLLDLGDGRLGFFLPAVHDLPAGAFRQVAPDEDDDQREHRADQVGDPPAERGRDVVQGNQGDDGAEERAGPVGAVDRDVHPAPELGRDHLVDGRVDRRVLTADAHAGDDPGAVQEDEPVPALGRQRGQPGPDQVDRQGDQEQVLAAQLVRQLPEEQRADDLADQVPGGDVRDRAGRHVQRVVQGQVGPTLLAMVISRPSRTHATPSATTILVWNLDQGSRSIRAGIRLRMPGLSPSRALLSSRPPCCARPRAPPPAACPATP